MEAIVVAEMSQLSPPDSNSRRKICIIAKTHKNKIGGLFLQKLNMHILIPQLRRDAFERREAPQKSPRLSLPVRHRFGQTSLGSRK